MWWYGHEGSADLTTVVVGWWEGEQDAAITVAPLVGASVHWPQMCGSDTLTVECSRCEQLVGCACAVLLVCAVSLCPLALCTPHSLYLTISPTAEPSGQTTPSTAGGSVAHPVTQSTPPLPGKYVCVSC